MTIIPFPKPYSPTIEAANADYDNACAFYKFTQEMFNHKDNYTVQRYRFARERMHIARDIRHSIVTEQLINRGIIS
jgi:hypothetical protein